MLWIANLNELHILIHLKTFCEMSFEVKTMETHKFIHENIMNMIVDMRGKTLLTTLEIVLVV